MPRPTSACRRWTFLATAVLLAAATGPRAQTAAEPAPEAAGPVLSWSAFGTLGWSASNRPWRFQRYIDSHGSFDRDSVLGGQLDVEFTPQWSATVQARLSPSAKHDSRWDAEAAWAFVAWRPNNDWLLRAGKLRVPFLMRSEQLNVGQTYDEARLPSEIYTLAPTNDFTGLHLSRTWSLDGGDLGVEAYRGQARLTKRFWIRDGLPPLRPAGAQFEQVDTTVQGVAATWRTTESTARASLHWAHTERADGDGFTVQPTLATLGPGLSYWQTDGQLPGPGVATVGSINNLLLTLGGATSLGSGWRVAGELARVWQRDIELGIDAVGAYATVYRSWGLLTPYVTVSGLYSTHEGLDWVRRLDTPTLPAAMPGAALLNASMKLRADTAPVYRQHSLAVGAAYALTPHSKVKAEWLHTRASISSAIDLPPGEPLARPRSVDVMSLSISFVY